MKKTDNPEPLLPVPLQQGDTIGLFCPAGPIRDPARVDAGIDVLLEMGFRVRGRSALIACRDSSIYLAGPDTTRAEQLHGLWAAEEVKALMAVRGGYGCLRMLGCLEFSRFQTHPKWLIGFSDLTALLAATFMNAGLIGLHGPVVSSLAASDALSKKRFFSLLTGSFLPYVLKDKVTVLRSGTGRGRIVAGNLTTICHLIGTPWEPALTGTILLLEDTGEPMYKIDRMLTQLAWAGRFDNLTGLVLGTFDAGDRAVRDQLFQHQLFERVLELTAHTDFPIWGNFPFGHLSENQAIPYGMEAAMESGTTELTLYPG